MDVQTDTASRLRDHGTRLESIVNAFDGVLLHGDKEARRQLWVWSSCVEKGGGGMGEIAFRHQIIAGGEVRPGLQSSFRKYIRFNDAVEIATMNADGDAHEHLLRTLCNTTVDPQKIGSFQGLEAEAGFPKQVSRSGLLSTSEKHTNCSGNRGRK
jgi:hypothetical protein